MEHYGDITKINGYDLPMVDCITGGSPCQDLSVAGSRTGLNGNRSGLFMEQIRIIKEMRERDRRTGRTDEFVRPRYMVWENVPGAFSTNEGEDFRIVLEETAKVEDESTAIPRPEGGWKPAGCIMGDGWSIAWRVHDAQFWGVPQRRKRISLVADFGGQSAPEILFERKGLSRNTKQGGASGQGTAERAERSAEKANRDVVFCLQGNGIDRADTARCNGKGWRENQSYTLNTMDRHAVCAAFNHNTGAKAGNIGYQENVSPCLRNCTGSSVPTVVCIGNGQVCNMSYKPIANALDTMHDQQAIFIKTTKPHNVQEACAFEQKEVCPTLTPFDTGEVRSNVFVVSNMTVRRLTPLECERLQGFPDGWTDIGDWIDGKGKKHKGDSDSPRYRALGNSIALPFWFWLLRRISAQYERPATLGSLFDGIGGFPLCWERCNGVGTALWASEIAEFPVVVTKHHFKEGRNENG